MYCANLTNSWGPPPITMVFSVVTPNPPDLTVCQYVLLTGQTFTDEKALAAAQALAVAPPDIPYDYQIGAAFWGFGFAFVMSLYLVSHVAGLVIKAVRDF